MDTLVDAAVAVVSKVDAAPPPLAPLAEADRFVDLTVASARDAKVAVPLGADSPRPILVAVHGNFDRPEWTCDIWSYVSDGVPFVVCPRGSIRKDAPGQDRWTYAGSTAANREIESAVTAAEARWGSYIRDAPMVYAGFSLGAILGVPIVAGASARFPRVILVEGGHDGWSDARAEAFAKGASTVDIEPRVLFICAQAGCVGDAENARRTLVRHHVAAQIVSAGNVGHQYGGVVAETTRRHFDWITEGMPGW